MKKLIIIMLALISTCSIKAQYYYDNGPLTGNNQYVTSGVKWSTNSLTYYIENSASSLTTSESEQAIQTAFSVWSDNSVLSFTQVSSPSSANIKLKFVIGSHGDDEAFDGSGGILAHAYLPPTVGGTNAGCVHFDNAENWSVDGTTYTGDFSY